MTSTLSSTTAIGYFVAVPGNGEYGIYGVGRNVDAALAKAYRNTDTCPADVSQEKGGDWVVSYDVGSEVFNDEDEAREYADELGFIAQRCTERLYIHVERYGWDTYQSDFRWAEGADGLVDLDLGDDERALEDAVGEVLIGFYGLDFEDQDGWTAKSALQAAHDYVDAYVIEGDQTGKWGRLADEQTPFRTALDLRVRDIILERVDAY